MLLPLCCSLDQQSPPPHGSILSLLRRSMLHHVTSEGPGTEAQRLAQGHSKRGEQPGFGLCSLFPPVPPTSRLQQVAGANLEVVTCGSDTVGPGRSKAFKDSLKQPQPIPVTQSCRVCLFSVGVILVLLADTTAHQIKLRDRQAPARGHTAAFTFLNWQWGDILASPFMCAQLFLHPALPQGTLERQGQDKWQ